MEVRPRQPHIGNRAVSPDVWALFMSQRLRVLLAHLRRAALCPKKGRATVGQLRDAGERQELEELFRVARAYIEAEGSRRAQLQVRRGARSHTHWCALTLPMANVTGHYLGGAHVTGHY